ncbi:MAG TPA: SdpI family protein, partial [Saprospiraceae bacterium]|nr:SdpI family protein [Saprospiraceae bacterium]
LPGILSLPVYVIMLLVPRIDPKHKIEQMGGKFYTIRLVITIFMSALGIYIINASYTGNMTGMNYLFMIIGAFFAVIGNYMPAMRPNYFMGIRTPWTLENEEVWKNTHRLGGKIWVVGGLLIFLLALLIHDEKTIGIVFISMIVVLAGIPILYSYFDYRKLKAKSSE